MNESYIYCDVLLADYKKTYMYISDFYINEGEFVVIPFGANNTQRVGLVLSVTKCTELNAPYPPQFTKHIIKRYVDNVNSDLENEKNHLEKRRSEYIKSDKKINKTNERFTSDSEIYGVRLSKDGKKVVGYKRPANYVNCVHIPCGVETIEDTALIHLEFDSIYIPKTLKNIGMYTLCHPTCLSSDDCYSKNISRIEVEDGNPYFAVDDIGFYSLENGKRKLCYIFDKKIEEYISPDDVVSFSLSAFDRCDNLKKLILSPFTEEFNEYILSNCSKVADIFIPASVKCIIPRHYVGGFSDSTTVRYRIDENNPYLFQDEDSIYEVLSDGTYRLIMYMYPGRGKVHILDKTSEIGEKAFYGCKNVVDIEFPKSLRKIGKDSFAWSGLKEIVIPEGVVSVEELAFYYCCDLKSVQIHSAVEYVAKDAFLNNTKLKKIKSENKSSNYTLVDGMVKKANDSKTNSLNEPTKVEVDFFENFAENIIENVLDVARCYKDRIFEMAIYDSENRVISITTAFIQKTNSPKLLEERVECAEHLCEKDPVCIKTKGKTWEIFSQDGKSLGIIDPMITDFSRSYLNKISIRNAFVFDITPKSKRKSNAKYAIGAVDFEIIEKDDHKPSDAEKYFETDDESLKNNTLGGR